MNISLLAVGVFVIILFGLIFFRVKTGNRVEIKPSDIILALIPIVLWLLLTGKIQKFEFGEFKVETAFVKASKSTIAQQVTELPIEALRVNPKGRIEEIPRLIEKETQALSFQLGYPRYEGYAIEEYFKKLSKSPLLKHIIIEDQNGKFVGIIGLHELTSVLMVPNSGYTAGDFASWLRSSNLQAISRLPGFVSAENAISEDIDKRSALEYMESLNIETLPVIDKESHFAGIVDRSRLTASLIIDVAQQIE